MEEQGSWIVRKGRWCEVLELGFRDQTKDRMIVRSHIVLDRNLERQRSAFYRKENHARRMIEEKRRQFRKPEKVEVPDEFRMTEEDFLSEFAASTRSGRKSTIMAPRARSSRRHSAVSLQIPKTPLMSEECSAIYKDLQSYVRKWRNPPSSILGGNNKSKLERTLRDLAYDISPDGAAWRRIQSAASGRMMSSQMTRREDDGRPPTCGPGSRIYEKQKWLAEQIQEYEARQTEDEKKKKDKEEALRKERRQLRLNGDGRGGAEGTSLWSMMQRSLLVTNKYIHNVDHSHDMNISDVDVRSTRANSRGNSRRSSFLNTARADSGDTRARGGGLRRSSQRKGSSLFQNSVTVAFEDHKRKERRMRDLMKAWKDSAWQEAQKARYIRTKYKRPTELEVEVFPRRESDNPKSRDKETEMKKEP